MRVEEPRHLKEVWRAEVSVVNGRFVFRIRKMRDGRYIVTRQFFTPEDWCDKEEVLGYPSDSIGHCMGDITGRICNHERELKSMKEEGVI